MARLKLTAKAAAALVAATSGNEPAAIPPPPKRKPGQTKGKSILKKRTGEDFQNTLKHVFDAYHARGIARIEKVDPPTGIAKGRVFMKASPWLDYSGTWTEMGGRHLILEAKSTEVPKLSMRNDGGITSSQCDRLLGWHRAGALVAILWHHKGAVKVVTAGTLVHCLQHGFTSIKWQHLPPTPKGEGMVIWDILASIADRK